MTETTAVQLRLIGEISEILAAAHVQWWLFGGWAVDFHLGRVSREHGDIEFYIRAADAERVSRAFRDAGFAPQEIPYPDEAMEFREDGQLICAVLLVDTAEGIVIPGRWTDWPWPRDAFDGPPGSIGGLAVPIVTVEALLDRSLNYQKHAPDAPPLRERDVIAIEQMRALIASRSVDDW
jgi:lincosamide nucleotidyltransferase A/C/D/E